MGVDQGRTKMLLVADEGFTRRFGELVDRSGGQNAFARLAGMSQSGVARLVKGGEPTLSTLKLIARASGQSLSWLIDGENPEILPAEDGVVRIPILDVAASAGPGADSLDEAPIGAFPFATERLRRLAVNPLRVRAFRARGDSMEPTIQNGALVLVDTGDRVPVDGQIFALRGPDGLRLKRIQRGIDGAVVLISDNAEHYSPERVSEADVDRIRIVGRACWSEHEL